ncbi:MAG: VWA domain-containing protein [Clostridiales bacterium]|jgi:uncharacterized protein YegL|nr:VWA domain-containing protein [Clostridiales bacterium]
MLEQMNYYDTPTIVSASEPHMACLLLVDVSGSMDGAPITLLNDALNRFKNEVCADKRTREILDVAVVSFNHATEIVQPWVPIEYMEPVNLTASGGTSMAPAVETAVEMIEERERFYKQAGTVPYKPWIVMISDGFGGDVTAVAKRVVRLVEAGKLNFFSLGVEGYDPKPLHLLSGERVMKLKGYDFYSFFNWVGKSMRSVSQSSPGERPKGLPLPENVDKDTTDWM